MRSIPNGATSRRVSLQDVAKAAGVSAAAVSYVVNGRTGEVSAQTLQKIELAIKTLRYKPQRRGLSLKFNREFAIGLVIVDPNPSFLADPFTTHIATGLGNALMEPGFGLTVTGCDSFTGIERLVKRPIGVDAFVVVASGPAPMRERIYGVMGDVDLPLVVIQENAPDIVDDACGILQDDFGGARLLTRHLLDLGAKRFLFAAPFCAWPAIERRESGIRSMLGEDCSLARIECREEDFDMTAAAIELFLDSHPLPDAIMGANDQIAIAALRVLEHRGLVVPRDVRVTGYNDFPFRNFVRPLLTTVRSSALEIGRSAAQAVLARIDKGAFPERTVEHGVTIDVGGTTSLPRDRLTRAPRPAKTARGASRIADRPPTATRVPEYE